MASIRFGTSGWRAVLAEDFTFGNARRVVAAIARTLEQDGRRGELLLVGFDTRFLAGRFAAEAGRIFLRAGFPAEISARPIPTPVLAFEILRRRAAGAVNFTASHNPPQYLGIKFSTSDGAPALPEVTQRIEAALARHYGRGGWSEVHVSGPPAACIAGLRAVADGGAELILLNPMVDDTEQMERLAADVIPEL